MRVLFCGPGYGAGNIGDDAILSGALIIARKYLPKETQYGAIVFQSYFTEKHADVNIVFQHNKETNEAFNWATHVIFGGATLIGDWGISHCAELIKLAHSLGKPACMLGVGVTNKPSRNHLELLKETFSLLDLITVRSNRDKEIAVSYGLSSEKLKVCADLAFAINYKGISYKPTDTFGINLVHENLSERHSHIENLKKFLTKKSHNLALSFICGEARKDGRFDYFLLQSLHKQFGGSFTCKHLTYFNFLKLLTSCHIVLTMRMHMVIFCSLVGVPCIPLVRERKTKLMADSLGLSHTLSLDESPSNFCFLLSDLLMHPKKALADIDKVDAMKKRALDCNGLLLQQWVSKTYV